MMTSVSTSTWSNNSYIISDITNDIMSSPPPSSTVTPAPTSNRDFVYVEYDDYSDYSSYEDPSVSSESLDLVPTTTKTKTAAPESFRKKTAPTSVPRDPVGSPVRTFLEFLTTTLAYLNDIRTPPPGGDLLTEPPPTSPYFVPLSRKENNPGDEVTYRIVGLDSDATRGQQNYFVPRLPPMRERTHNKRIQELLNEKRRQNLFRRISKMRETRTDRKPAGL